MSSDADHAKLGDFIRIEHGWAFKGELFAEVAPGRPVVVKPGNFLPSGGFDSTYERTQSYIGEYPQQFALTPGELLVVMTCQTQGGEILGVPGWVPDDGRTYLHNQRIGKVVLIKPEKADIRYVYWLLADPRMRQRLAASATGSTVLHTSPTRIGELDVWLPSLAEQRRIASVLGALGDKAEHNVLISRSLASLTALALSDLLSRGYEERELGEYVEVIDCLHSRKPDRRQDGRPLLQLDNLRDDGLVDVTNAYLISEADYAEWTRRMETTGGDCVITNVGRVGAAARVPHQVHAALGRNMTGLRPLTGTPHAFLIESLLSPYFRREIELLTDAGTVMDALNVRNIPKLKVRVPPGEKLAALEAVAEPRWQLRERLLLENQHLASIRDVLLPKLISGVLRVPDSHDPDDALETVAEAASLSVP